MDLAGNLRCLNVVTVASITELNAMARDQVHQDAGIVTRPLLPASGMDVTGAASVSERTPIICVSFNYSVLNTELTTNVVNTTGTVTQADSMAVLSTGVDAAGSASLRSRDSARYIGGEGLVSSYSAIFSAGAVDSKQIIGLGNSVDGLFFADVDGVFGILHRLSGSDSIFVPQASWSEDPCDGTGPSGLVLDPTKGNVYASSFLWHGFGPIFFFVSDGQRFVLVHVIQYSNLNTVPHLTNPNLPFFAQVINSGNTSDIVLRCASAGVFVQGKDASGSLPSVGVRGCRSNTKSAITAETNLFTIRNKASNVYGGTNTSAVRIKLTGLRVSASAGGAANIFRLVKNATLGGSPSFADFDAATSALDVDVAGTTVAGGRERYAQSLNNNANDSIDLSPYNIVLNPGDTFTVSGSGSTSTLFASLSWIEFP
jgi:hypothetical protein